jgi:hypothetical protein
MAEWGRRGAAGCKCECGMPRASAVMAAPVIRWSLWANSRRMERRQARSSGLNIAMSAWSDVLNSIAVLSSLKTGHIACGNGAAFTNSRPLEEKWASRRMVRLGPRSAAQWKERRFHGPNLAGTPRAPLKINAPRVLRSNPRTCYQTSRCPIIHSKPMEAPVFECSVIHSQHGKLRPRWRRFYSGTACPVPESGVACESTCSLQTPASPWLLRISLTS